MICRRWFVTLLCCYATALPLYAQNTAARYPDATWKPVRETVAKTLRDSKIKGLSIAVVDDQALVWAEGFGVADVYNRRKATADTIYRAGNLSKLFTATAVMQLDEQGKINIDKPLKSYLPSFSIQSRFPEAGPITIRGILDHHSGLPCDWLLNTWSRKPASYDDYTALLRDEYTTLPPNMMYAYSNIGYNLLAHMVQQVSGRDFVSYMDNAVLKPTGMTSSSFSPTAEIRPLQDAATYVGGYGVEYLPLGDTPVDSLRTTVKDMAKFMAMVLANGRADGKTVLKPATLNEMLTVQNARNPHDFDVNTGLGWFLKGAMVAIPGYDGPIYGCGGATMTNNYATLVILPREKIGVVILGNAVELVTELPNILNATVKAALQARTGRQWNIAQPDFPAAKAMDTDARKALGGIFATDYFALVNVYQKSTKLYASVGKLALQLQPRDGNSATVIPPRVLWFFSVPIGPFADVEFSTATVSGHRWLLLEANGYRQVVGEAIQSVDIPAAWKARVGEYAVTNTDADTIKKMSITLEIDDGYLLARVNNASLPIAVALDPVNDKEAVTMGQGRFRGETLKAKTVNGQEVLEYSGFHLKKK